jgi:ribosomal protein S18 acetylase RimI-like enzyme
VLKPGEAGIALIGRPVTKEEFLFRLKDPLFECFIAFLGEKPAGSVFCELKDEKKGKKKHGWIYGLGVLSSYQRLKIGTTLLNRSLRFLK